MGKRFGIIIAILAVAGLGTIGWQLLRPPEPEPVYEGRLLSYWLTGFNGKSTAAAPSRAEACRAVVQIGTNALPVLLSLLRTPDSPLKDKFLAIARKQRIIKIPPPVPAEAKQRTAMDALSALGPVASNSLPQLIEIYDRHPNMLSQQIVPILIAGWCPAVGLAMRGPSVKLAMPMLIRGTSNTNENVRMNSVLALGCFRAEARSVVPALIKCLQDPSTEVRIDAASALWQIHAEPESAVPALIKCLRDPSPDVQANGAIALGAFGNSARQAVPALFELLKAAQSRPADPTGSGTGHTRIWRVSKSPPTPPPAPQTNGRTLANWDVSRPIVDALKAIDPEAAAKAGIK